MRGITLFRCQSARVGALGIVVAVFLGSCVVVSKFKPGPVRVKTAVFDPNGREVKGNDGVASSVLGLSPAAFLPQNEESIQDQELTPEEKKRRRDAELRLAFGKTVLIDGDLLTKRYFMADEISATFYKISGMVAGQDGETKLGGTGDRKSILGSMLGDHEVVLRSIEKFESVPKLMAGAPGWKGGPIVPMDKGGVDRYNDLILVTAKAADLEKFEEALDLFYSNIPQVEIEVMVIEWSTNDSLSFGVTPINAATPTFNNLSDGRLISQITSNFLMSPPVGLAGVDNSGVLSLGGIHDSWELNARLEMLQAQGRADIQSRPKLVVRNGGTATISTYTDYPFPKAQFGGNVPATDVSFRPVGITLGIRPIIAGTHTVILQVYADYSAVTGFAETTPPTPIVSKRTAITSVHVPSGMGTVIGGLQLKTEFETESKVPILGDIPILGYLFRASSVTHSTTNLSFVITPRIMIGGEEVRRR